MMTPIDYMQRALDLAKLGRYSVSPNPMVGSVIVKNNRVIGQGYHQKAGSAHAEIIALQEAREDAKDATLYITLEPCCHVGRTPPCTDAIIQSGIKKVVVACLDPNPLVAGKGIKALKDANIDVELGILETEAKQLNDVFFHFIQTKRPFITLKWAMSLDGKTVTHPNDDKQLSGNETIKLSHQLRWVHDAIMVGSKTIRDDNPLLTARYHTDEESKTARQPCRIVLTSRSDLPLDSQVFTNTQETPTIIITSKYADPYWLEQLKQKGVDIILVPEVAAHRLDIHAVLVELGKRQITSVLVEGGMFLHQEFMRHNLVNRYITYVTNTIVGDLPEKHRVILTNIQQIENDICIISQPK